MTQTTAMAAAAARPPVLLSTAMAAAAAQDSLRNENHNIHLRAAAAAAAQHEDDEQEEYSPSPAQQHQVQVHPNNSVTAADVLVGRGKGAYMSEGNLRFQKLVSDHLDAYKRALKNKDKITITKEIVDQVKMCGGRFLKEEGINGQVTEIDDRQARIKVAQVRF
jgi:hypothetical protein